jgi:hypothetical protein
MAPSKKNKGKQPIGESSQADEIREETVDMQPSKAKKFKSEVGRRELMKTKYVKFTAFPAHSFNFEELLQNSGVKDLVSEVGLIYPELVKTFYRNIKFAHDEFGDICMESCVNNTKMSIGLEDISKCLGIPNEGYEFRIGFIPSEEWKDFDTLNYFVEISRGTHDDLIGRQSQSSRVIKYAKSLTVSDRMLHYVLAYILVPRHSNHAQVTDFDVFLIKALKMGWDINWSYLFFYHLKHQLGLAGGLPYAYFVSKLLAYFNVPLENEEYLEMDEQLCEINKTTITKNTGIVLAPDGTYRYRDELDVASPEGGYSLESLHHEMMSMKLQMNSNHHQAMRGINKLLKLYRSKSFFEEEEDVEMEEGSGSD